MADHTVGAGGVKREAALESNESNLRKVFHTGFGKTLCNITMLAFNTSYLPQMNCKRLSFSIKVAACFQFATTTPPAVPRLSPMR